MPWCLFHANNINWIEWSTWMKLLNCLPSMQLFTSRPEKNESGTWEKVTQIAFQNTSQNSKIHKKTTEPESLCNKVAGLQLAAILTLKEHKFLQRARNPTFLWLLRLSKATENSIEIHQSFRRYDDFSPPILFIFIDFFDFFYISLLHRN